MATATCLEDLVAWQRCIALNQAVSELVASVADQGLADQMLRAANAAPALIAEGFKRYTTPEFVRYLRMARGELGELQTDLEIVRRRCYVSATHFEAVNTLARRAMGTTTNLLKVKLRHLDAERQKKRRSLAP